MLTVIKVTPEILKKSRPRCSTNCLIANAIDEVLKPGFVASVGSSIFNIRNGEDGCIFSANITLPQKAKEVINWYDNLRGTATLEAFKERFGTDHLEIKFEIPVNYLKKLPFNPEATCSPTATQCPRCNNPWNVCDKGKPNHG